MAADVAMAIIASSGSPSAPRREETAGRPPAVTLASPSATCSRNALRQPRAPDRGRERASEERQDLPEDEAGLPFHVLLPHERRDVSIASADPAS